MPLDAAATDRVTPLWKLDERPAPPPAPPTNIEAEQALLGAIFVNNVAYGRVAGFLKPEHFANEVHARIYRAIGRLIDRGVIADPIRLKNLFEHDGALADIGGALYLARLADSAVTIINAEHYGRAILDCARRRGLIALAHNIMDRARQSDLDDPVETQIAAAEDGLLVLGTDGDAGQAAPASDAAVGALEAAQKAYQNPGRLAGISTGLDRLDSKTAGLRATNLIIVGAATGAGKTNLGCTLAIEAALLGHGAVFFSGEMSANEIAQRFLARLSGVPAFDQLRGELNGDDWQRLIQAQHQLQGLPLHLDDRPLTLGRMRAAIRDLRHRRQAVGLVIVDYLQLIGADGPSHRPNRFELVSEAASGLKALAKQLHVCVVALTQLNRGPDQREDHRPILSDLRASGDIENFADIVMLLYRQEVYLARAEPTHRLGVDPMKLDREHADWSLALSASRGRAEIIIAKNRHGPIGTVRVGFDAGRSCFVNEGNTYDEPYPNAEPGLFTS